MKKTILLIVLMVLISVISVTATPRIAMDCDAITDGLQTTVECVEDEEIKVGFYITGATVDDDIDQISTRVDFNDELVEFDGAGKGTSSKEFMRDGGAGSTDILPVAVPVDSDTVDFSIAILGCHTEWAPSSDKTAMKNTFVCLADGTVNCGSSDLEIIDTRDIDTTKTWWAHGSLDCGGEKRLFEAAAACVDNDGDGYGVCPNCGISNGCTYDGDDCDDTPGTGFNINPGATETCNGINDDCNAQTDDGADEPWLNDPCDGADSDLCNEGNYICDAGSQTCTDNDAEHDLDLCNGEDDDCNAQTDDGADEAWLGDPCDGIDSDLCQEGDYICDSGSQTCTDSTGDDIEVCNNIDDDCDGPIDEDLTQSCGTGDCLGTQTCTTGNWGDCSTKDNDAGKCAICDADGNIVYDEAQDADCPATECPDSCVLSPDDNPFTWDYANDVPNECVGIEACSDNQCSYEHECSIQQCSAECESSSNCPEKCTTTSHKLYTVVECTACECEYSDYQCVVGKCDAECDEDTDCECAATDACIDADQDGNLDDYADYPDYGMCGTGGSEGCLCQVDTGVGGDCEPIISLDNPLCGCQIDDDCNQLDDDYCDGDIVKHDEGKCIGLKCQVETTIMEDCDDKDNIYCNGDEVWEDNGYCSNEVCEVDSSMQEDCNDYDNVYCNGVEIWEDDGYCSVEACEVDSWMNENCNDNVDCTDDSCNEATDSCDNTPNHANCNDGVGCTDDVCHAETGCENPLQDSACDDDKYCNGEETCHAELDCQDGTPVDCNDNVDCTDDSCNEETNSCDNVANDALCPSDTVCTDYYCSATLDCQVDYEPATTVCRAKDGVCDVEEKCTGESADCPADEVEPDTTECKSATDDCDVAENCDGTNKACPTDDKAPAGTECGEARDCPDDGCSNGGLGPFAEFYPVDGHDTCDGSGNCEVYPCAMETSYCTDNDIDDGINTLECGAPCDQDTDCTVDEICNLNTCECIHEICDNGIDDDDDGLIDCEDPDCAGQNGPNDKYCCQTNDPDCNMLDDACADGVCNANECEEQFKPATTVCQTQNGDCDVEEKCTGSSAACPADQVKPNTYECRASAGDCDLAENCDGTSKACPADAFKAQGIDCGICAECDGIGTCTYDETQDNDCDCPADECTDNNNDGIIDAYNDYIEGECEALKKCKDCGPAITEPNTKCKTGMRITVEKDFSMFSLPLWPEGGTTTFNDIKNGCTFASYTNDEGIAYWDPLNELDEYEQRYEYLLADSALYPGQGYFTAQENECEFEIEGYEFTSKLLGYLGTGNIHDDWNMIGAPSQPINNFDLIEGTCNIVSGPWDFNAASEQYVRTQKLEPGEGYFTKSTNNCNLG